jgi:hypothetical protein
MNFQTIFIKMDEDSTTLATGTKFHLQGTMPDGLFQTKNPNLGKFWKALE